MCLDLDLAQQRGLPVDDGPQLERRSTWLLIQLENAIRRIDFQTA
jgi:hypothetical protein